MEYLYKTLYKLIYDGKVVGFRLKHISNNTYFDIDSELLEMIVTDLQGLGILLDDNISTLTLINGGRFLVPDDIKKYEPYHDVDFLSYDTFMKLDRVLGSELDKLMTKMSKCDYELKVMYNMYNKIIFNGTLPYDVPVYYDSKLNCHAGECIHSKKRNRDGKMHYFNFRIRISQSYVDNNGKDVTKNVLLHEMIHVCLPEEWHGKLFMRKLNEINTKFGEKLGIHVTRYAEGLFEYNYKYCCKACGKSYTRMREIKEVDNYRCSECRGKIYLSEDVRKGLLYDKEGYIISHS